MNESIIQQAVMTWHLSAVDGGRHQAAVMALRSAWQCQRAVYAMLETRWSTELAFTDG